MDIFDNYMGLFNAREMALIIWLLIFFVWAILKKKIRDSFSNVGKAFFKKKVLFIFIVIIIYVGSVVFSLAKIGIWQTTLIKDTIIWFSGTAFILMMNANKAAQEKRYFKKLLEDNLKLNLIVEFIMNLYSFNLLIELILVPFLFVIIAMSAYVEIKKDYLAVKKMTNFILSIISIFIIMYAFIKIIGDFRGFLSSENMRAFVLPPLLTFAYIPFLYIFALLITYENIFFRIAYFIKDSKSLSKNVKWKIFRLCHLNLNIQNRFSGYIFSKIVINSNEEDINKIIKKFRADQSN